MRFGGFPIACNRGGFQAGTHRMDRLEADPHIGVQRDPVQARQGAWAVALLPKANRPFDFPNFVHS